MQPSTLLASLILAIGVTHGARHDGHAARHHHPQKAKTQKHSTLGYEKIIKRQQIESVTPVITPPPILNTTGLPTTFTTYVLTNTTSHRNKTRTSTSTSTSSRTSTKRRTSSKSSTSRVTSSNTTHIEHRILNPPQFYFQFQRIFFITVFINGKFFATK
nr:uncharacterized protein CTRU02_07525 [Colletotrichum truncatum]KAF6791185.1 hypothetical protein CTRU02_07525 [Colletotrichum truncatum]